MLGLYTCGHKNSNLDQTAFSSILIIGYFDNKYSICSVMALVLYYELMYL